MNFSVFKLLSDFYAFVAGNLRPVFSDSFSFDLFFITLSGFLSLCLIWYEFFGHADKVFGRTFLSALNWHFQVFILPISLTALLIMSHVAISFHMWGEVSAIAILHSCLRVAIVAYVLTRSSWFKTEVDEMVGFRLALFETDASVTCTGMSGLCPVYFKPYKPELNKAVDTAIRFVTTLKDVPCVVNVVFERLMSTNHRVDSVNFRGVIETYVLVFLSELQSLEKIEPSDALQQIVRRRGYRISAITVSGAPQSAIAHLNLGQGSQ